jgi:regulator of sirC expression with transglutaminase-like and TPR domain
VAAKFFHLQQESAYSMSIQDLLLAEISQPDQDISLARAALFIAQTAYPDLDIDKELRLLAEMAQQVGDRLPPSRYPLVVVRTINDYLYSELGFTGNISNYYDPRNSFLNDVLARRTGIPITLALVYLEIARQIDFPMIGIGMPGHFMIRPDFEDSEIFIDAFNQGEILFAEDCRQKLMDIYQQDIPQLSPALVPLVTKRQFIGRMLNNLQVIYLDRGNLAQALVIKDLLSIVVN